MNKINKVMNTPEGGVGGGGLSPKYEKYKGNFGNGVTYI